MNLVKGIVYKVKNYHLHHPSKMGRFQFLGGPELNIIVMSELQNDHHLFAVDINDLTDFNPETDQVIE